MVVLLGGLFPTCNVMCSMHISNPYRMEYQENSMLEEWAWHEAIGSRPMSQPNDLFLTPS